MPFLGAKYNQIDLTNLMAYILYVLTADKRILDYPHIDALW